MKRIRQTSQIPSAFSKLSDDDAYAATIAYIDIMKENNYSTEQCLMIAEQLVVEALGVNCESINFDG
jgi:hypothetical protein